MIKEIGIHYIPSEVVRGPEKVARNLIKGLEMLGVNVYLNEVRKYNGCLQYIPNIMDLPANTLLGPNIMVMPHDHPEIWSKFKKFIHPSQWPIDIFKQNLLCGDIQFFSWPSGIDTDEWINENPMPYKSVLIYAKGNDFNFEILNKIGVAANEAGFSTTLIKYGDYSEDMFKQACLDHICAIVIAGTESQGIAQMEMLSMDLPLYIIDKNKWHDYPATSAPYFNHRCGIKTPIFDANEFRWFLTNVENQIYSPRQFILNDFTLEQAALNYLKILEV